jgi:S-adenosylmethionine synthetase
MESLGDGYRIGRLHLQVAQMLRQACPFSGRVNGFIALNRPRWSEAAAGKNPVSHVGKIYNGLAHRLADKLHTQIPDLREVVIWLCSRIGSPIDQPQMVSVQTHIQPGASLADVTAPIRQVVQQELAHIPSYCQELAEGRYAVC